MSEGDLIIDDYQLLNCIVTGNHTAVWEVMEQRTGNRYAMKLLLPDAFADSEQKQALKHEAKVAQSLDQPNFVKFHKLVINKEHGYILMEYFRSINLKASIVNDLTAVHARIKPLLETTCLALGCMHEHGWLHRDMKPDNILFNKASEVRLIDFSLATRIASGLSKLFSGKVKFVQGTRTYIAPETIRKKPSTVRTDIYSLGVTIFEILTGRPPFKGSSPDDLLKKHLVTKPLAPSDLNPNVTPQMDQFVLRMLAKKPENRHADMREINAELRNIKIFKEDVQEGQVGDEERRRAEDQQLAELNHLDSRADAERTALYKENPELAPKKKPRERVSAPATQQNHQTQQPQVAQPGQSGYQQPVYLPPGYQQMGNHQQPPNHQQGVYQPYPGYPPPQYPGYHMPGYPPPPQAPFPPAPQPGQVPQMQMPAQHYPDGQVPSQQYPQPGVPPQMQPPSGGPPQQQPPAPAPPPQQPPGSAAQPPQEKAEGTARDRSQDRSDDDDLPYMEELPEII